MYHKSFFPPLPQIPPQNIHNILFHRPDQADWPDYPLHVNPLTGAARSFRQFLETVRDGATAIASDVELGGLGIRPGNDQLVGVLCENSMVCLCLRQSRPSFTLFAGCDSPLSLPTRRDRPVCVVLVLFYPFRVPAHLQARRPHTLIRHPSTPTLGTHFRSIRRSHIYPRGKRSRSYELC